jgi:hypothetical protein
MGIKFILEEGNVGYALYLFVVPTLCILSNGSSEPKRLFHAATASLKLSEMS